MTEKQIYILLLGREMHDIGLISDEEWKRTVAGLWEIEREVSGTKITKEDEVSFLSRTFSRR